MTVKQRIVMFLEESEIKTRTFEKACGFSNGYLRQLTDCPSVNKLEIILSTYPDLNRVWLMTGEGEMLKSAAPATAPAEPVAASSAPADLLASLNQVIDAQKGTIAAQKMVIEHLQEENRILKEEARPARSAGASTAAS